MDGTDVSLVSRSSLINPYPVYDQIRDSAPVIWHPPLRAWLITRYADVTATLRDSRLSAATTGPLVRAGHASKHNDLVELGQFVSHWISQVDPPSHTQLRGLLGAALESSAVAAWQPRIEAATDRLLDRVQDHGRMDLVAEFAYPLPAIVIAQMLGFPPDDRHLFHKWTAAFMAFPGSFGAPGRSPGFAIADRLRETMVSLDSLREHISRHLLTSRGQTARDTLPTILSVLAKASHLRDDELIANVFFLIMAGHQTVADAIANATLALLSHPSQRLLLRKHPNLLGAAIEELLRFEPPVQAVSRIATAELMIADQTIHKSDRICILLGAANRDHQQYTEPHQLDICRNSIHHMTFGYGPHYCLGSALARIEIKVALSRLLNRFPMLRLAEQETMWHENSAFRGVQQLIVEW